jgi:RecB family endonuclease NucS
VIGRAPAIGKIERVPLREVWRHEAHDLTTWLEENIDVLNDALDVNLTNVEREHAAGAFSVDLVAEDDSGGLAVIENELERSNTTISAS